MEMFRFEITEELEEERIDKCLSMLIDSLSRSFIQKLIRNEAVTVNGQPVRGSYRVKTDDIVTFALPESVEPDIRPENIPLDILYEDKDVIVVNKPKGMVVHPAAGHYSGTLVNALLYHCGSDLSTAICGPVLCIASTKIPQGPSSPVRITRLTSLSRNSLRTISLQENMRQSAAAV